MTDGNIKLDDLQMRDLFEKVSNRLRAELRQAGAFDGWRKVEAELPEPEQGDPTLWSVAVLVWAPHEGGCRIGHYDHRHEYWEIDEAGPQPRVTHWQPLPGDPALYSK